MKIIHCCFGNEHYIDTWGYQQNLLPYYHAKLGHETVVLASNDTFPSFVDKATIQTIQKKGNSYYNGPVRIERGKSRFPSNIHFQKADHLYEKLVIERPDIIFFHGSLNLSIFSCVKYKKQHPEISLFVDNHADTMNVNTNKLYRLLFFKVFWSILHKYCQQYVDRYFGVTMGRCFFLRDYFHIKNEKIQLLPIGADVESANSIIDDKSTLRKKNGYEDSDIILVHGGKLDIRKGTVSLIKVFKELRKEYSQLKLVLFGKMEDPGINPMLDETIVVHEWLSRKSIFELFKIADLAIWPIHHTTLIEDCIASNLPYLIRKTDTTQHLINDEFYLNVGDEEELLLKIKDFLEKKTLDTSHTINESIKNKLNYYNIAETVVEIHNSIHNQNKLNTL